MKIAAILDDYNSGAGWHKDLMGKIREKTGADYLIAVMSGDFTEDSLPARADKYRRAAEAVEEGADLVLEIPVCAGLSDLSTKVFSGVSMLKRLYSVDELVILCRDAEGERLSELAGFLFSAPAGFQAELKEQLKVGKEYYAAQAGLVEKYMTGRKPPAGELLSDPVNRLAIETIKSMYQFYWTIPVTFLDIGRLGAPRPEFLPASRQDEALGSALNRLFENLEPEELKRRLADTPDGEPELCERVLPYARRKKKEKSFWRMAEDLSSDTISCSHIRSFLLKLLIGIRRGNLIICGLRANCPYGRVIGLRDETAPGFLRIREKSWISLLLETTDSKAAAKEQRAVLDECGQMLAALDDSAHALYADIASEGDTARAPYAVIVSEGDTTRAPYDDIGFEGDTTRAPYADIRSEGDTAHTSYAGTGSEFKAAADPCNKGK